MKKGIVALLVILALIVFISPALVGRLAEQSVETQLKWASDENREVVITSTKFDRGWFSSEGQHRIAIGDSAAGTGLKQQLGFDPADPMPTLLIDTHLDHGLIPVSSITRDDGSLLPGLGRAVSTLSIESVNGEVRKIPGKIYSSVGLDGGMTSLYFLEAGSVNDNTWGAGELKVSADALSRRISIDGDFDSFSFASDDQNTFSLSNFQLTSDMTMSDYGYALGDIAFAIDAVNITSPQSNITMSPIRMDANTELDGDRVNGTTTMSFAMAGAPPIGDVSWTLDATVTGLDAVAAGRLQRAIESADDQADPRVLYDVVENDLLDIAARGLELRFDRFDISLPQGTLFSKLKLSLPESDRRSFAWPGALLALDATAYIRVSNELYEFAAAMNPQLNVAVAMGFLQRNGDEYEMDASYRKGLLTVNGAPMPLPIPGN